MESRSIEIDLDVHQAIELNRLSFSETSNDILRRLLKLGAIDAKSKIKRADTNGKAWRKGGVELPHGTELRMEYGGEVHLARILEGKWVDEFGKTYFSPSGAAIGLAKTREGKSTNLNGKNYWYVKRPGDQNWTLFRELEK